jgi:hypothetical protein
LIFAQAVKNGHAAEAVRLLKLCLRSRMNNHQPKSKANERPAKVLEWFRACDDAVDGNPYVEGASPALAFWSLKGETEQQFYRRVVLTLEELLLGIVMAPEFRARRRLRSGARRSARSSLVVSTQRPRRSS